MHPLLSLTLLVVLAFPTAALSASEPAPQVTASAPVAAETFVAGTLRVQRHGDHGRPVILIPGLASGAWVWDETVAQLCDSYTVYVVTLAGFDGLPAPQGDESHIDRAAASLVELMDSRHIERPVLIGHSLGGTLAIRLATIHADRLAGVVAVDGLPVFPGFERLDDAQRRATAARVGMQMSQATAEQFQAMQLGYMQTIGTIDPAIAGRYAPFMARSDAAAAGRHASEILALDLRADLPAATLPMLVISPYNAPDFSAPPLLMSEIQKTDYYRQLLGEAPQVDVVSISPARHFAMLDQPEKFQQVVSDFLAALVMP